MGSSHLDRHVKDTGFSIHYPAAINSLSVATDDGRRGPYDQVLGHCQRDRGRRTDHGGAQYYFRHVYEF